MPISFNSPPRNFFLLGSSGEGLITNFFSNVDLSAGTDGQFHPDEIRYNSSDQKYILAGTAEDTNSKQFGWFEKRDYDGTSSPKDWDVRLESTTTGVDTTLRALEIDNIGNLIVVGKTGTVPWIARYSNSGNISNPTSYWHSTSNSGDVEYTGIASDGDTYYACGTTTTGDKQAFVERFYSSGMPGWGKSAFMLGRDVELEKIAANSRGEVVAVGSLEDDNAFKGYIVKLDTTTGDVLWDRTLESSEILTPGIAIYKPVFCHSVFIDGKDQIYVVGRVFSLSATRGFIIKYSPEGNIIWQKETPDNEYFEYYDVKSDSDVEQTVVFGRYKSGGDEYGVLTKYSKNGDIVFRRLISSSFNAGANFGKTAQGGAVNIDADPSFYYLLFVDDEFNGLNGTPDTYTFGKVSTSGNGFGNFQYDDGNSETIDYDLSTISDRIGKLSDGSVRNDTSDLTTYPFGANQILFDDLSTQVSNKRRQMESADSFEYSGSPALRPVDFQELNYDTSTTDFLSPGREEVYTAPGTYSFIVPATVTSVSAVVVGGGGGAGPTGGVNDGGGGGAGGGLAYGNISVTAGEELIVTVGEGGASSKDLAQNGSNGGTSTIVRGSDSAVLLSAGGGQGGAYWSGTGLVAAGGAPGGTNHINGTGGVGGSGGISRLNSAGGAGGGAAGYSGNGGDGASSNGNSGGTSGAGGGGSGGTTNSANCGGGGGVGIFGEGASGVLPGSSGRGGNGGSSGANGSVGNNASHGGIFGGGGGADDDDFVSGTAGNGNGGGGAVRIIWGAGRAYPSTNTTREDNVTETKVTDKSGKGRFGKLIGGVTKNASGYWDFDGVAGTRMEARDLTTELIGDTFTAEAWIYPTSFAAPAGSPGDAYPRRILSCNRLAGSTKWCIGIDTSGRLGFGGNGGVEEPVGNKYQLSLNTYYHVMLVHDATEYKLYVDGVEVSSNTTSPIATTSSQFLAIGGRPDGTDRCFAGRIGEVRIYTRALTAAQVFQNYNSTKSPYLNIPPNIAPKIGSGIVYDSNLLLNYDFRNKATYDDRYSTTFGTPTTVNNLSSSTITGTLNGGASINFFGNLDLDGSASQKLEFGSTDWGGVLSIEMWIRTGETAQATIAELVATATNHIGSDVGFRITRGGNLSNELRFGFRGNVNYQSGFTFTNNQWEHYVITFNDADPESGSNFTSYKNGSSGTIADSGTVVLAGQQTTNELVGHDMWIGEFRIYDKVLTATEVSKNFNATRRRYGV